HLSSVRYFRLKYRSSSTTYSCSRMSPIHFLFFFLMIRPPPTSTLFPYTTLFRSIFRTMLRGVSTAPVLTAADVERMSIPGKQVELVRGQLVVREPPGTWHGAVAANLAYLLGEFVRRHGLGLVFAQDTGFKIGSDPDTVRAPDV